MNTNGKRGFLTKTVRELGLLIKAVPTMALVMLIITVFSMNLLANKSIYTGSELFVLDCGMLISWVAFLTLDVLTKHFGPKAATLLSVFATAVNLLVCLVFFLASLVPGVWGQAGVQNAEIINAALDKTFGGSWYVIFGSAAAFLVSSLVNNFTNYFVGKALKNQGGLFAFLICSYVSTAIGQFADNFVFALTVSRIFFGWTLLQCTVCALTGMAIELICEGVFAAFGYKICEKWKKNKVGEEYFAVR